MYVCIRVCAYSWVVKCVCVCMHIPVCESGYMHVIAFIQRSENSIWYQFSPCTFLSQGLCCSQTSLPVGIHDVPVLGSLLVIAAHRLYLWVSRMSLSLPFYLTEEDWDYRHRLPHLNFAWVLENCIQVFTLGQHTLYPLSPLPSPYVDEF